MFHPALGFNDVHAPLFGSEETNLRAMQGAISFILDEAILQNVIFFFIFILKSNYLFIWLYLTG